MSNDRSSIRRALFAVTFSAAAAAWLPLATGAQDKPADDKHTTDTLDQVKKAVGVKRAILLDVREVEEWKAGHLQVAQSLPISKIKAADQLKQATKDWDKSTIIYTHCAVGRRALACAPMLRELGFDVRPLKAGYKELLEAGFEKAKE